MEINFITKALLAGVGIAVVSGPLGCFITWRRMAYFGDTLAHSALFGISLSLLFHINNNLGLIISSVLVVCFLGLISKQQKIGYDSILGILSHSILALGLIIASMLEGVKVDLLSYLYGDILTVSMNDLYWIFGVDILAFIVLLSFWSKFVSFTVHEELAKVEGINTDGMRWLLFMLMALVFAIAVKLVGVLLITALLVIPAASARFLAKSPEQMALLAIVIGCIAVFLGVESSLVFDIPTGPAIVVLSTVMFIFSITVGKFQKMLFK